MSHQDGGRLRTDTSYPLDEPVDRAWDALARVEDYRSWWPWLRCFDAGALAVGERWQARISVSLPWPLRFTIDIDAVVPRERVDATLTGDVEGTAAVTLQQDGSGTTIGLVSALEPRHRLLRTLNRLAPPLSRRLHDRVVDKAFRQFAHRPDGGAARPSG